MKIIPTKMRLQIVEMTVEEMQEMLDRNHPHNRRPKENKIRQFLKDMLGSRWVVTHEAIAEDEDGNVYDGQNRLSAGIRSGMPQQFALITGVPREALAVVNCGATRNVADAADLVNKPFNYSRNTFSGTAKAMLIGLNTFQNSVSIPETLAFIDKHRKAIEFNFECMHVKKGTAGFGQSGVRAVIARAWYRRGARERVKEFCDVLVSGLPGSMKTDKAALVFRNWIIQNFTSGKRKKIRRAGGQEMYAKAEFALNAFLNEESITRLDATRTELFPIPGEADAENLEDAVEVCTKMAVAV